MPNESDPPLGIIMLDTEFARPPGDVGHPASWPFPVRFGIVRQATARRIVGGQDADLLDGFIQTGEALQRAGAVGLITSCGFLAARQRQLARRLTLPVATSSLMQIPIIARCLPHGKRVGVITYDSDALGEMHFTEVGADPSTPVVGLPANGRFRGLIEGGEPYDRGALEAEVLEAAARLLSHHDGIGAILLECTNLPPFSEAVTRAFKLPVYDIIHLGRWFYSGLKPSTYRLV